MEAASAQKRAALSDVELAAVCIRYHTGESQSSIARSLKAAPRFVFDALKRLGGMPYRPRKRSERVLSLKEREEISRGLTCGKSFSAIGLKLERHRSTIKREVDNNGGRDAYRAVAADERALANAKRPKECKLAKFSELAQEVAAMLLTKWSPQQIQAALRLKYPNRPEMNVSHETLYKTLYIQARGALKKELLNHLRTRRVMRAPKVAKSRQGCIPDMISISKRPAEVEDRAVPGHWEGDLIAGYRNKSFIGTLVERTTRYVKLIKIDSKNADDFAVALTREVMRVPSELRLSLTWDQGSEMARHKDFTVATDVKVYFCDPHSPWQRGSNENTNGLLRQYFPNGQDLSGYTQEQLDAVARELNERPRQTLGWSTPAAALQRLLATTAGLAFLH